MGKTAIEFKAGADTVTVVCPFTDPELAVTVVTPSAIACTKPSWLTWATVGTEDDQVTKLLMFMVGPCPNMPVATSCWDCPTGTVGLIGVTEIFVRPDSEPIPERLAVCRLIFASSVTVTVPVRVPNAVGVKVTEMLQVDPAASLFGESGQFEVCAKSPEAKIPEIVRGIFWLFLKVRVWLALGVVTSWPANERLAGENTAGFKMATTGFGV